MKQTTTNRMGSNVTGKNFTNIALRLFFVLALSGTSFTYAQQSLRNDLKLTEDQPGMNERNTGAGVIKGISFTPQICPVLNSFSMLDMGFDKAILTWDNSANFDSILFRFGPTGSSTRRIVGIPGNPNPDRYFLMGLLSQTSYDIEISTICSSGGQSAWSTPITVLTLAEPAPRLTNSANTNLLTVNPNPVATITTISFMVASRGVQHVSIISSTGRIMYSLQVVPQTDKVMLNVDLSAYPSGIYVVRVSNLSGISNERLIKL